MSVRAGIVALFVVGTVVMGGFPVAGGELGSQSDSAVTQQADIDADEVRIDIAVRPDGSAEWDIEFWVRLDDEESTEAFESVRDDIEDDPTNRTQEFSDRIDETVAVASEATGREMSADEFRVSTRQQSLAREYGVVRYSFRWHGFAGIEDENVHVGDAIDGIYLDDGTRLLIEWPEEYELSSVAPDPDDRRDRAVIWRGGDTDFISGEPRVVVSPVGSGLRGASVAVATVVVGAVSVFGVWWYRNRRTDGQPAGDDEGSESTDEETPDEEEIGEETPDDRSQTTPGSGEAVSSDLLSNEEQVLGLVENHDGRMKQQAVVEELGWTDAKTSKVVSTLREEGKLESFRLGRENVLSLPEDDE